MADTSEDAKGKPHPKEVSSEPIEAPDPDEDDLDDLDGIYSHMLKPKTFQTNSALIRHAR